MSSFDKLQRRLDSALVTSDSHINDVVSGILNHDTPNPYDVIDFQKAVMRESTANYASGQLSSLTHSLSKNIIDSIN
ncbi:hypothetical protein ED28_16210 [[Pantoea] beijingensis]|uniref:HrpF protein n=1 Tax=[Pantoea] beijingensis TaxID=1324864 RepID=A0A443IA32_9GAMM|nr:MULTISPECIES: type III secretion protein HrpF [Erwiniaceae]RWR00992.1 hypothetical protein ED28_16210 [[Pantoea] beijingensis]